MLVRKRERRLETYNARKLAKRLETATFGMDPTGIDIERLVNRIQERVTSGMPTENIEELAIRAALRTGYRDYGYVWIAAHLEISKMHKSLHPSFSQSTRGFRDSLGNSSLSSEFLAVVSDNKEVLDEAIIHLRDYDHTYDMIRDIQDRCLARTGSAVLERIQHMFMRTAVGIHMDDIPGVLRTYELLSSRQIIHDPFTYLNAGMTGKSLTSSYCVGFSNASVQEMYNMIAKCVFTVRDGGRVAISAQNVPCTGRNPNCRHENDNIGLWPMLKLLEGAIAFAKRPDDKRTDLANICVEPWHVDIRGLLEFLNIHRHDLSEQKYITATISVPDIFMVRVEDDSAWSLFCPRDVPDLINLRGDHFEDAFIAYERSGIPRVPIRARELWDTILRTVIQTGGPSIVYKDTMSRKTNLPDMGVACHSDLRTGMVDTSGVDCRLLPRSHASIALPLLITSESTFDFEKLSQVTKEAVINLNKVLDSAIQRLNTMPDPNKDHRAIGLGIHGLSDVFAALRMPYNSPDAGALNSRIAETMYYAALEASCDLAQKHGPYPAFSQSPLANGRLQFDLWNATPSNFLDWETLRSRVQKFGVRNAAMIAIAPGSCPESYTGYTDSADPPTSNVLDEQVICPWLARELSTLGLWNEDIRERIINAKGMLYIIYRTAWEIDPETIIRMTTQRAPFVCQTQGLSLHLNSPTPDLVGELLMRTWAVGLKTGLYKLNTRYPDQSSKDTSSYEEDTDREMSFEDVLSGSS
ncbi:hypothetical protein DFH09DRAFT_1364351 [Mycena vulgaris]|nr:hypothetical protein DFH09DRAFT_1364351 [Mycena vulgaris]